jgi:hypothetical protein
MYGHPKYVKDYLIIFYLIFIYPMVPSLKKTVLDIYPLLNGVRLMHRALMRFKNPCRLCTHKVLLTAVLLSQRLSLSVLGPHQFNTVRAPWINIFLKVRSPRLLIPSMRLFSPLACWRGVSPIQAAI